MTPGVRVPPSARLDKRKKNKMESIVNELTALIKKREIGDLSPELNNKIHELWNLFFNKVKNEYL